MDVEPKDDAPRPQAFLGAEVKRGSL